MPDGGVAMSIRAIRSDTEHLPCAIILDHHPADSRTDVAEDQQAIQTLTSRMGTGGGNVPMILEYHSQALRIKPLEDDVSPTIPAGFGEGGANTTTPCLIVEPITYDAQVTNPLHKDNTQGGVCHTLNNDSRNYVVIPIEGNGARPSHRGDGYRKAGPMYSLNTTEVHSVAYAFEPGILKREGKENRVCEEIAPTIREHMGDNQTAVAYTVDMGGGKSSVCTYQEQSPTLACTHYGEPAVAYTLKIRGGCDTYMKWDGKQGTAGKGALIQIEKSATLAASQDQYLFQPIDNSK